MLLRLFLFFVLVPLVDITLLVLLSRHIPISVVIAIAILTGFIGAKLTRSQGTKAIQAFQTSTAQGRMPHAELVNGLLILIAGAVLLTPGFLTDAIGFLLLIPKTRSIAQRQVMSLLAKRFNISPSPSASENPSQPDTAVEKKKSSQEGLVIDV